MSWPGRRGALRTWRPWSSQRASSRSTPGAKTTPAKASSTSTEGSNGAISYRQRDHDSAGLPTCVRDRRCDLHGRDRGVRLLQQTEHGRQFSCPRKRRCAGDDGVTRVLAQTRVSRVWSRLEAASVEAGPARAVAEAAADLIQVSRDLPSSCRRSRADTRPSAACIRNTSPWREQCPAVRASLGDTACTARAEPKTSLLVHGTRMGHVRKGSLRSARAPRSHRPRSQGEEASVFARGVPGRSSTGSSASG
jgi:hypothetical protein